MNNWMNIVNHSTFRYIDHSNQNTFNHEPLTAITSFAIDDALALSVSKTTSPPILRLWVHDKTVVLGMPDTRLPYINEGINYLRKHNYDVIVRNSGGLAVALDSGVLNLSLILPGAKHTSIYDCYEAMVSFIKFTLRDLTSEIQAYEIVGSYCPGDYDLSINGIKFAGISQRRIKDGAAIQIYIDVSGSSKERGELIQYFYDVSLKNEETTFTYPTVQPETMSSLSSLLTLPLTVENMKRRVYQSINLLSEQIISPSFSNDEVATFQRRMKQMKKRNEIISPLS